MSTTIESRLQRFCQGAAADLTLLARLHDRELDPETVAGLREGPFAELLGLELEAPGLHDALALLDRGIAELPAGGGPRTLDPWAADFADIYLNHGLGASPCESVWLDEDGLTMQGPMFQVRGWYQRHGMRVADWRRRTDDHLVCQLQFLALLFAEEGPAALGDAAAFLDEHPLRWVERFAARVAARCATPYYAGLAAVTDLYLEALRDLLARILETPRPSAAEIEVRLGGPAVPGGGHEVPFIPGAAPSW